MVGTELGLLSSGENTPLIPATTHSQPPPAHHPGLAQNAFGHKFVVLTYLVMGAAAALAAPFVAIALEIAIIAKIISTNRAMQADLSFINNHKVSNLNDIDSKAALETLKNAESRVENYEKLLDRYKNEIALVMLSALPFGIFAVASILRKNATDIKETGLIGDAEALVQGIGEVLLKDTFVGDSIRQLFFFPNAGKTWGEFSEERAIEIPQYSSDDKDLNELSLEEGLKKIDALLDEPAAKATNVVKVKTNLALIPPGGTAVGIPVDRGDGKEHKLQCLTFSAGMDDTKDFDPDNYPTITVFHGNGETAQTMEGQINTYRRMGYNVLAVTMGGYPGSDEGVATSEVSSIQDANAAMLWLKENGVKNTFVHGSSMGGSLAFDCLDLHPDFVTGVVAHQTFNRAKDVAVNTIKNQIPILRLVPSAILRGLIGTLFPAGVEVPGVMKDGKPYTTDGLDNERKAQGHGHKIIAIKGEEDNLMGLNQANGIYKNDLMDFLGAEKFSDTGGGHMSWSSSKDAERALKNNMAALTRNESI